MAEPIYYHALGLPYPPPANLNLKLNLLTPHHSTHTTTEVGPLPAEQITSRALPLKFTYLLILPRAKIERAQKLIVVDFPAEPPQNTKSSTERLSNFYGQHRPKYQ